MSEPVKELYRLNPQALDQLRASLPKAGCTAETTPLQAGFLLGIQHVLQVLGDKWTVK